MKLTFNILVLFSVLPAVGFSIYPVFDSMNFTQSIKETAQLAEQIKKTEDQISNQIKQIDQAKQLFTTTSNFTAQIGDWKGVYDKAKSIQLSTENLAQKPAFNFSTAFNLDYTSSPVAYTGNGLYQPINVKNALGQDVVIDKIQTARYAAVEQAGAKLDQYLKNTDDQLVDIRKELATTYEDMNKPGLTQAEQVKLAQKADSLNSRIRDIQNDRAVSIQRVQLQQALNENQKAKEEAVNNTVQDDNFGKLHDAYKKPGSAIAH